MIEDALAPLGDEYLSAMKKGFRSRWVDVYPTKNKRSGAYSSGTFLTQPYILMNYHGTYDSVSTLAHEMGHSMHSYFSRGTQPYVYSNYDIFCAEVASTCNEIILQHYVLERTTDPKKKLYLLGEFLEGIRGTVFRQTMFSEFEQRVHEMAEAGQALTADALSAEYGKIMKKYYGPAYTHDDLVDSYWIRIPHFYYNFYVYKYATSYCAASNIARRIMAGRARRRRRLHAVSQGRFEQVPDRHAQARPGGHDHPRTDQRRDEALREAARSDRGADPPGQRDSRKVGSALQTSRQQYNADLS
jgi:oligoendopeptidase F